MGLRIAGGAFVLALLVAGAAEARVDIVIDKRSQSMSVSVDGFEEYSWPVSTGRAGYSTPAGSFKPFRLEEDHYSKEWDDAPMPYSIFFTEQGHAIHGSNETKRLGSPASHGCVRLEPKNAEVLFRLVEGRGLADTRVTITGADPGKVAKKQPAPQKPRRVVPRQMQPEWDDEYGYYDAPPDYYEQPWEYPPDYGWEPWW
jgi:hypothetical protein